MFAISSAIFASKMRKQLTYWTRLSFSLSWFKKSYANAIINRALKEVGDKVHFAQEIPRIIAPNRLSWFYFFLHVYFLQVFPAILK